MFELDRSTAEVRTVFTLIIHSFPAFQCFFPTSSSCIVFPLYRPALLTPVVIFLLTRVCRRPRQRHCLKEQPRARTDLMVTILAGRVSVVRIFYNAHHTPELSCLHSFTSSNCLKSSSELLTLTKRNKPQSSFIVLLFFCVPLTYWWLGPGVRW